MTVVRLRPATLAFCLACVWLPLAAGAEQKAAAPPPPLFTRQGQRYTVPESSALRSRLAVAEVHEDAVPDRVAVPAVVEADPGRSVNVLAPFTGRLLRLNAHLGDPVAKGQLLAEISAPDLTQAFSDLAKARDAADLASKARDRARAVLDAGGNAGKDLEQAESAAVQARAEQERAASRLKALGFDPEHLPSEPVVRLTAPVAGTITAVSGAAGGFLSDPTAPLLTVGNLDAVWVTAQVPENLVAQVHVGQAVDVDVAAWPDHPLHGKVGSLATVLDPDTRRTKARIPFANPGGRLRPNMYATANFIVPRGRAVRVPQSALVMINDSTTVLVEVAPWTFERREVELGSEDEHGVRVLKGLQAGQRVVVRGGVLLND